jgi:DNA polymerase III delta subunit
MKKVWIHKADSFADAEEFERNYYSKMSPSERLETVQILREVYFKLKKGSKDESRKGLRRVLKIAEQK